MKALSSARCTDVRLYTLRISNSYTMGCPPVRGVDPRALASGLTPRTGRQTWYN